MTFYEQVGIVIPGSVFVFGLLFFFPALQPVLTKDGVSLGDFGIFLLLSYAAGHLIAAVGNVGERLFWWFFGGMPTDWITRTSTPLLSSSQVDLVEKKLQTRLGITDKVRGLDPKVWRLISRQMYADIAKNGKPDRIDTFNGMYGLNRGLAAATISLGCIAAVQGKCSVALGLFVLTAVYDYRAYRFGVHYGRELYLQFLVLNDAGNKSAASGEKPSQES
jgi:hypothetical protein